MKKIRKATDREDIFANNISDKGLMSRIYKVSKYNKKNMQSVDSW